MRFLISEKLGPHKYKTPEGYLVCVDAILSRTGTQEYRRCELFGDACDDPDKAIMVDRKADEVFSDKTMASFENKAICIEHPNTNVNVENHNDLSVGFVRDIHRGEDNDTPVMMGTLVITDKEAVEAVESGEYKELSCGYDCDIEDERSPQQRNIRGNHVALCKQGRAGIARIVDSKVNDGVIITSERSAKFDIPGYHYGDIGKCTVWYGDLKHVKLQLDGAYKKSEKSSLIWIAGKTEYAGKEGRNTGKFRVKYDIWSTFTGVSPYLTSTTISGVVVTDDVNILKDVSEAFMNDVMKTVNDLISKMRSKGLNDDVTVNDAYTDFEYGYRDGKLGTYDKWYRYNRKDEGKEYDMGIQKAKGEGYEIKNFINS